MVDSSLPDDCTGACARDTAVATPASFGPEDEGAWLPTAAAVVDSSLPNDCTWACARDTAVATPASFGPVVAGVRAGSLITMASGVLLTELSSTSAYTPVAPAAPITRATTGASIARVLGRLAAYCISLPPGDGPLRVLCGGASLRTHMF